MNDAFTHEHVPHHHLVPDPDDALMTTTMYQPFQYYHDQAAVGAPSYLGPPHGMHSDMADHTPVSHSPPPGSLPAVQVTHATPTKLRSRRMAGDHPQTLDVTVDTTSAYEHPGIAPVAKPSTMAPRSKLADDEEARRARKREMGRERQRRKRLRDKEKREAAKSSQQPLGGPLHDQGGHMGYGVPISNLGARDGSSSRPSFSGSTSSYEGIPSSASTTYSNLPPMSMTISPSQSFTMSGNSSAASYSDASSPANSFSPTLSAGFASDSSSWQEHTAVFGNLSLSGDATVRASKPRATSAGLSNVTSRRQSGQSGADFPFGHQDTRPSPAKRRKSEMEDGPGVGLGVVMSSDTEDNNWDRRRPASVPDGSVLDPSIRSRSATPPPFPDDVNVAGQVRLSPEGIYFANTVVQALTTSHWGAALNSKLGMTRDHVESMGQDIASTYERWRLAHGMSQVTLDPDTRAQVMAQTATQSPPPPSSPRSSSYATPAGQRVGDVPMESPSNSSTTSSVPNMALGPRSSSTTSLSTAAGMRFTQPGQAPETPQSKATTSSSNTSPINPTLQTPSSQRHGVFPPGDYQQWPVATAPQPPRLYDTTDWRGQYPNHSLSSPITGPAKDQPIPPAPSHMLQSPITVQPGFMAQEYNSAAGGPPRGHIPFTPATPVPQRGSNYSSGPGAVPMFYNPQMQHQQQHPHQQHPHPLATSTVQNSPPQPTGPPHGVAGDGDMFLSRGFAQ